MDRKNKLQTPMEAGFLCSNVSLTATVSIDTVKHSLHTEINVLHAFLINFVSTLKNNTTL
jgi:hypothetical protein